MRQEQEKSEDKSQADEEVERPPPEVELGYVDTWINAAEWVGITFFFFFVYKRESYALLLFIMQLNTRLFPARTLLSLSLSLYLCVY